MEYRIRGHFLSKLTRLPAYNGLWVVSWEKDSGHENSKEIKGTWADDRSAYWRSPK